jgi:hypothetical protein
MRSSNRHTISQEDRLSETKYYKAIYGSRRTTPKWVSFDCTFLHLPRMNRD